MKRLNALFVILVAALLLAGCQAQPPRAQGPQLSLPDLVAKINANNQKIPTLWARIGMYAEIRDPETGKKTTVYAADRDGSLQYRASNELRLRVIKDVAGLVLDLGLNQERFWVAAPEGPNTMWWGEVGGHDVSPSQMPIRPQDVLEVLAIRPIDLAGPDAPTMRYNGKEKAYVLTWYRPEAGRYAVSRQVFYDQKSLEPKTVLLFDTAGKLALRAKLSNYGEIDAPSKPAPSVSKEVELYMPESRSTANLRLLDVALSRGELPNDTSFRYPEKPPVAKVIRVDAQVSQ